MGKLLPFPHDRSRSDRLTNGRVHCWPTPEGGFEIGHEARSGDSWGSFEQFDDAQTAVVAAYSLACRYGSGCDVHIAPAVIEAVPDAAGNPHCPGEW